MENIQTDQEFEKKLLRLVIRSNESGIKDLLKQKTDWHPEELGKILWRAVRLGSVKIASILIRSGADVNVKNPFNETGYNLLHYLISSRDPRYYKDLFELIIEQGADINACTKEGQSVLHRAIIDAIDFETIKRLFELGARVKQFSPRVVRDRGINAIYKYSNFDNYSFDDETTCERAVGALLCCCGQSYRNEQILFKCAKYFLDMPLAVEDMESDGLTILLAINSRKSNLVKLLIAYGFDVNKQIPGDSLPLYTASRSPQSDITDILIRAGAKVNALSRLCLFGGEGLAYPIHAACRFKSVANIQTLLRNGANFQVTDSQGRTPFSLISCMIMNFDIDDIVHDAHRVIIRYFAIIVGKGQLINNYDWEIIRNRSKMYNYYNQCVTESKLAIFSRMTVFYILSNNLGKLLFAIRHQDFVDVNLEQWNDQFPIYFEDIKFVFKNALKQKPLFKEKEKALYDSLKNNLPYVPLEKIIYYMYLNIETDNK